MSKLTSTPPPGRGADGGVGKAEACVGQAVAEREERCDGVLVIPAVVDVDPLAVVLLIVDARVGERVARDRRLVLARREGLGELAGRVDLAVEQPRRRLGA